MVEDGEINQKLIIALLTQAGVSTINTADNGEIGVRKATESDYDVILLDMQMPVMDGYTAARTLREQGNETPIIALTAHAMKGDKEKCFDAGCNDYLSKPINAGDLISKIASCLPTSNEREANDKTNSPLAVDKKIGSTLPIENPVFLEIVQDFGDLLDDCLPQMRDAAENQNREQLTNLAHNLLGTAGGAGFDDFTEPARELEMLANESRFSEAIETPPNPTSYRHTDRHPGQKHCQWRLIIRIGIVFVCGNLNLISPALKNDMRFPAEDEKAE